jgi:hypothetical protein
LQNFKLFEVTFVEQHIAITEESKNAMFVPQNIKMLAKN